MSRLSSATAAAYSTDVFGQVSTAALGAVGVAAVEVGSDISRIELDDLEWNGCSAEVLNGVPTTGMQKANQGVWATYIS